jgi:ATP-dependent 26S proteasome regulatory subunit
VDDIRGTPMGVGSLEEIIDDDHAIISASTGPEYYVSILSFVDKDLLEPGCSVLLHHKVKRVLFNSSVRVGLNWLAVLCRLSLWLEFCRTILIRWSVS